MDINFDGVWIPQTLLALDTSVLIPLKTLYFLSQYISSINFTYHLINSVI